MPADVRTGLPQVDLNEGTVVTVTVDDPGAVITRMIVHGWQEVPTLPGEPPPPLLAILPDE